MTEIVQPYNTAAKRVTYEDFGGSDGAFGWRIRWEVQDHWADVKVWEVTGAGQDAKGEFTVPLYEKAGSVSCEPCEDINEAETYLEGYIKWDGCTELDMGCPHWCGPDCWQKHIKLLGHLWVTAFELMGKPLTHQWQCPLDRDSSPAKREG